MRMKKMEFLFVSVLGLTIACAQAQTVPVSSRQGSFVVEGDHFLLNGKEVQILSGEMHYSRIPRAYWKPRMEMAKAMGLNTIATYVFWNVHEPRPGVYDFAGDNDLAAFVKLAQEEHLNVLLRAGPYSCAEWEFGGFPAWLLADPKMGTALRTNDDAFMMPVERWIKRLAQEVGGLQIERGGPIIAVQIENEYGNFSNDHTYMQHMKDIFVEAGFDKALLYTVDPSRGLASGEIDGIFSGVNFGTGNAERAFTALEKARPGQPLFATEYWPGWFDLWGHPHETRPIAPQLADLDYILRHKGSVNIYMFHGGTSFGMMAGASQSTGSYRGNVTSYDYDAPLDEAGHPTPKFFAYRDLILKYTGEPALPVPAVAPVIAIPEFALSASTPLWEHLPKPVVSEQPLTMEQIGQDYGYILYRKELSAPVHGETLHLDQMQDFALVYLDGKLIGTLDRHYHQDTIALNSDGPSRLDILVENTGRLNSTKFMRDERKGIRAASLDGMPLTGWQIYTLPMRSAWIADITRSRSRGAATPGAAPTFASGSFNLNETGDSFLDVRGLGKGLVWINGHALGRFWKIGPQGTLYVPAPWLIKGTNHVAIFEVLGSSPAPKLAGLLHPILDMPTPGYESDPEHKKKPDADAEFAPSIFSVASNGAKGDGVTLETAAIQRTIDEAAKHGGTVIFPAGTYLTGSIFIKSNITLQIDKGVTLLGSQHIEDYPLMPTRIAGIEMTWPAALINIYRQNHANITGEGTIDGDGKVYWDSYWALRKIDEPKGLRWASDYDARRPRLIQIFDSSDVKLSGVMLRRSGFWTVHICYSHDVTVDGITIRNNEGGHGPSTDGIDIDSSRKILVEHADIAVNDDALCLKAGRDSDGLRVNRPTEDIVLRDSIVREGAAGVTIGSETSGGFRNIEAYGITTLSAVPVGILFKSAHTRGGFAENIRIHDMTMTGTPVALRITMNWNPSYSYAVLPAGMTTYPDYYKVLTTPVPEDRGKAHFHDVHIWNIAATGAKTAFEVDAYPSAPLENFSLEHLHIQASTAGHISDAKDWKFSDISLTTADGSVVALSGDSNVTGIASREAPNQPKEDPSKKSFAEQDKNR